MYVCMCVCVCVCVCVCIERERERERGEIFFYPKVILPRLTDTISYIIFLKTLIISNIISNGNSCNTHLYTYMYEHT